MAALTFTYFDFEARAQWQRLALIMSGVEFNDVRISGEEFQRMRAEGELPFGQVPVLDVQGKRVAQSNAIARYIGRIGGLQLYPSDPLEALLVDEILEEVTDVINIAVPLVMKPMSAEEKEAEHERLIQGPLSTHLGYLEKKLEASGSDFFVGSKLTLADLAVFSLLCWPAFPGSTWTAVPDALRTQFPLLSSHFLRIRAIPAVNAHVSAHA